MFQVLFKNHVRLIVQQSLYWGTALFVIVFAVVHYNLYFVDQAQSFWSGETSPPARYVIIYLGGVPLALMMLVSCFLSTRTYAIESQFKIKEVLFTKPFGNLVHALSATTASTLFCALPMLGFVFIVFAVSAMQGWLSADVAEPFELVSTGVFLVFTTLVSLSFASLLSYFVYYAIRITILSVLASTAITTGIIYALTRVSFNQFVLFEFLPLVGDVASDMIADKLDYLDYCRFLAFVCLCATLTVGATWVVARRDQLQKLRVLLGGYLGAITSVCFAILFLGWFNQTSNIQKWQQHVMDVNDGITLDLQELSGSVVFAPGKNLAAEITVKGTLDDNVTKDDQLVFWLNPGFNVHGVQMDDRELPFEFDTGKLLVNLSHEKASSEQVELTIKYRGRPNTRYGYQDSSLDAANMPYWDQLISYYGMSPGVFDRKYVALPHATHWLPTSPRQTKLGASSIDFVEADLRINVPRDWVVILAGNASMQDLDKSDDLTRTFQFTTEQPLSGISLYANALNKYSTHLDAADVTFELYISERQLNLLQEFQNYEKYIEVFKTWMVEIIDEAKSQGYSFTCDTYRLVAVPSNLRVYGGGIFMDSVITEPCTYLIREHGAFATKLHEVIFFMGEDYDYTPAYRSNLEAYFRMRTNGGDLALGLADHFFKFDVGLKGPEGEYMKMVLSYLHHLVWTNTSYAAPYSPSVFFPRAMKVKRMTPKAEFLVSIHNMPMDDATLQFVLQDAVSLRKTVTDYVKRYTRHIDQTEIVFKYFLESDAVLDFATQHSLQELANLDPTPITQEAIRLRCAALAQKIYQLLGRDNSRTLLQELSKTYRNKNITVSDVFTTAQTLDLPVKEIMAGWFNETEKFHYSFSPATVSKKVNPDTLEAFYQVTFAVASAGNTAGVFRTSLRVAPEPTEFVSTRNLDDERALSYSSLNNAEHQSGPRILIPAGATREVGIITNKRPYRVKLRSYDVSQVNEISMIVRPDFSDANTSEQVPFEGTRPSTWTPEPILGIVVDDTDLRVQPQDDGVITYDKNVERFDFGGAWGIDRRSFIYTENAKAANVLMDLELPTSDQWQIEFHVPDTRGEHTIGHRQRRMMVVGRHYFKGKFEGEYEAAITSDDSEIKLDFEISDYDSGWLQIGSAELAAGPIEVSVVPKSGTEQLVFDAIRFLQLSDE